jgi:hypothetical protein
VILKIVDQSFISIIDLIRISITTVSCIYLYKGRNWAKLILGISASLELFVYLYSLYRMITNPSASFAAFVAILSFTILSALAAYYLLFSGDVEEFIKSRKPLSSSKNNSVKK